MAPVERSGKYAVPHTLHGGSQHVWIDHHFADSLTLPIAVQTWVLSPGAWEGMHAHEDPALEELYIVVWGQARIVQQGNEHHLDAGDSLLSPVGTPHDLMNTGDGNLRILVIWGPPGSFDMSGFGSYRKAIQARSGVGFDDDQRRK